MLTQLHVRHFKAWRDSGPLRLAPLTLFLGANSVGKSTLVQALQVLAQSPWPRALRLQGDPDSGGVDVGAAPGLGITLEGAGAHADPSPTWSLHVEGGAATRQGARVSVCRLAGASAAQVRAQLDLLSVLGPWREPPRRRVRVDAHAAPWRVGAQGEHAVQAVWAALRARRTTSWGASGETTDIGDALDTAARTLGLAQRIRLGRPTARSPSIEVRVHRQAAGDDRDLADVGVGLIQAWPVLAQLVVAPPGAVIALSHPDMHLHPQAQAAMADVLIDSLGHADPGSGPARQLLIETHSEWMLHRIQRRIAEGRLSPADVAVHHVSQASGRAHARELALTASGDWLDPPPALFGDELAELVARAQAALQQRRGS